MKCNVSKNGEMNKTNICFFLGSYGTGGAEDHVLQIVNNLNREEFNINLVIFQPKGKNRDAFHAQGINIFELPLYKNKFVKHFIRFFDFIPVTLFLLRSEISVAHIHLVGIYLTSMFSSILAGVNNRVITWHNIYDNSAILWDLRSVWANMKFLFRVKVTSVLSNSIVAVSQNVADNNAKYFQINKQKVFTVHNGIKPNNQIRPIKKKQESLKVIAVGSLTKQKGYFVMLESLAIAIKKNSIRLDVYGDGPLFNELKIKIQELGIKEYVKLKGRVHDIPKILPNYDVYLNTSYHEGFSIAVLEAMNAQLGIIATAVGGTPEAIIDNHTGLLVPIDNPIQVAKALNRLANDFELLNDLAINARKEFLENFSLDNMMIGLEKLYSTS